MPWSKLGNLSPPPPSGSSVPVWTRPADWLALPAVSAGEQKLVGLYAVYPQDGANFATVLAGGPYTVDWGDGTAPQDAGNGVQTNHVYNYATIPAGSASTRGYRQVVVTITPQAGQTLSWVDLGLKHPQAGLPALYCTGWLDIRMAGAAISSMRVGMSTTSQQVVTPGLLEQFEYVGPSALTGLANFFTDCFNLQSIKGSQWTSNVTGANFWLTNCQSLRILENLNFSSLTSPASWLVGAKMVQRYSNIDLRTLTTAQQMFENNTGVLEIASLNISKATTANAMFNGCSALQSVAGIDLSLATDLTNAFKNCVSLRSVKGLVTPKGAIFTSMFSSCTGLSTVELFDTSQGTSFDNMFFTCTNLKSIPAFNTVKGTLFGGMFNSCRCLLTLPALNMAAATSMASFVAACSSLSAVDVVGLKIACDFSGCRMSSTALNALYTNLGTVAGLAINVTSNYGTSGDNPSIATAKGWTVTGT